MLPTLLWREAKVLSLDEYGCSESWMEKGDRNIIYRVLFLMRYSNVCPKPRPHDPRIPNDDMKVQQRMSVTVKRVHRPQQQGNDGSCEGEHVNDTLALCRCIWLDLRHCLYANRAVWYLLWRRNEWGCSGHIVQYCGYNSGFDIYNVELDFVNVSVSAIIVYFIEWWLARLIGRRYDNGQWWAVAVMSVNGFGYKQSRQTFHYFFHGSKMHLGTCWSIGLCCLSSNRKNHTSLSSGKATLVPE